MKNRNNKQFRILILSVMLLFGSLLRAQTITINNPASSITSSSSNINFSTDSLVTSGPIKAGKISIGSTTFPSVLNIGSSNQFQVNSSGNLIGINGVTYSWPSSQGAANTMLLNNGSGTLSWVTPLSQSLWQYVGGSSTDITYTAGKVATKYLSVSDSAKMHKILPLDGDSNVSIGARGFTFRTHKKGPPGGCYADMILGHYIISIGDSSTLNQVKVGIGTATPDAALNIYSAGTGCFTSTSLMFSVTNTTSNKDEYTIDNIGNTFIPDGKLAIGVTASDMPGNYRLYVKGGILTEHCRVAKDSTLDWSDYVFSKSYKLPSLDSVESYVNKNHHLKDVPSTDEVTKNGIDVAEMDAKLLKKIEELTLYVIQLQKDNAALKNEINTIKK